MVVLGEAGMGKSTLLRQLDAEQGYVVCTARALINAPDFIARFGDARTLVIDALDEVSAQRDGDAVDMVVRKLAALGYPRFILSCRIADWRSATGLQGLTDLYGDAPVELHLEPLDRPGAVSFLSASLGGARADGVADYLEERGLAGLWSNPQTLGLVEQVARDEELPASKGELFAQATELLAREHREAKAGGRLAAMSLDAILDAAGAAFTAIILTGSEAVSTRAMPAVQDIALADLTGLDAGVAFDAVLESRLFAALEPDRFTYAHRAIGEFLGARWLTRSSDSDRKRRRALDLFNANAMVPASLRGMFAWLAWHGPQLAEAVIAADPMAVVQYGDADRLTVPQARGLINALGRVAADNPRFRDWTHYRVAGLAQPALVPQLADLIGDAETAFGLKLLLLQALQGSPVVARLAGTLEALVLNQKQAFANRSEAGDRLVESGIAVDWPAVIAALHAQSDEDGVRLAIELMDAIGYNKFDDDLLTDVVLAQLDRTERTVGVFLALERNVGDDRLDVLLDGVAAAARRMGKVHERPRNNALTDLADGLLARRLRAGDVAPDRLWSWLEPFNNHYGFRQESKEAVASLLRRNVPLKRGVQRHVLLGLPGERDVWTRSWRIAQRSSGLNFENEDIIALLDVLKVGDTRWRDLVRLARHSESEGGDVRAAAARLAAAEEDGVSWLVELTVPRVADWEIREEKRRRIQDAKREREWQRQRAEFTARIDAMRRGEYGLIINPAKAYLKLFSDMGDEADDGPARLAEWLGPDLRDAALAGFEAFLNVDSPRPTATELADSYADSRRWEAAYVIVSALAERQRTGIGFADLADERLMAGLFELRHTRIDDHAGLSELDGALESALRARGVWEAAQRLYFEPQFAKRRQHVDGLYALLRDARDAELARRLAEEWLSRYPEMADVPEAELVDYLMVSSAGREVLRRLVRVRRERTDLNDERRRNWDAVGFLVDFDATIAQLMVPGPIEPELFWHVRARIRDTGGEGRAVSLEDRQLIWMLETFRSVYPSMRRPDTVTTGDTNPWDASEFVGSLIGRLGDETSDVAIAALAALRDAPADGYTELLRVVGAEQRRKRVEADWHAPQLSALISAVTDAAPTTAGQLQLVVLDELVRVQRQLRGSDIDWYRDFFTGATPKDEEACRDSLLKMLRPLPYGIQALPEGHLADDKRADIICLLDELMVPIEVKGQWHKDLWTAADAQLDHLYVNDWRAERGIYLVFWFGTNSAKPLKAPPKGTPRPDCAATLQSLLKDRSATTRDGRVEIIVVDLTRPS